MSIKYRIEENNLKPGTFYARVLRGEIVALDDMIPNIVAKTSLTGSDLQGAVSALREEIVNALVAGNTVVIDGVVTLYASLSGSFDTPDQIVTRETANLKLQAQCDQGMQATVAGRASYDRETTKVKLPIISSVFEVASKTYDRYAPASVMRLMGDYLKFDPAQPDEGVFIHDGATETRLTIYSVAGEKQIDAVVPPGVSGALTVTVRTRYTPDGELRQTTYHRQVTPV